MSRRQTLTMERTFAAPPERVFDAFTNAEVMRRWWRVRDNWDTPEAVVELEIGGEIRVVMRDPDKDARYGGRGRYTEIERPSRLAFTWIWDDDREQVEQSIEIDFIEQDGKTVMRFVHRDLWDEETVADHEDGWSGIFEKLGLEVAS